MLGSWSGLIFPETTVRKSVVCLRVKTRMDAEVRGRGCYVPLLSGSGRTISMSMHICIRGRDSMLIIL